VSIQIRSVWLPLMSIFLSGVIAFPVIAKPVLEEVLVTARKKEESLQEAPVAVSAFSQDALQQSGIKNLKDFNKVVPGMDVNATNGASPNANIFIRGVGQRNSGANIDSGVGIYLDGIYLARPDGALLDINDISSVQILRGPQGTLFGKNTTGGAVVFTTTRPSDEYEGSVSIASGSLNERNVSAMVNIPLSDAWASRFSFVSKLRDGFIDNEHLDVDAVNEDRQAAMLKFRYMGSESLTADINFDYSKVESTPRPSKCQIVPGYTGWLAELFDAIAITPSTGRKFVDFCQDSFLAGGGDKRTVLSDLDGQYLAEVMGVSLQFDWDIGDSLNFKSITGYRNTVAATDGDLDGTEIVFNQKQSGNDFLEPKNTDQFTQEFQLTGELLNGRVQYITGLFFFYEDTDDSILMNIAVSPMSPAVAGPTSFFLSATASQSLATNASTAAFVQFDWELYEKLHLITGLRYTREKRDFTLRTFGPDASTLNGAEGGMAPIDLGGGLYLKPLVGAFEFNHNFGFLLRNEFEDSLSNEALTPMISLQYVIDETGFVSGGNAYATYSNGFLSGGINEAPSGLEEFRPEEVDNFEVGLKVDIFDRRVRVNTSVFNTLYTDRQLTTLVIDPNTSSPVGATKNAEKSSISGLELESTFLLSENLMLLYNGAWMKGEIDEYSDTRITYVGDQTQGPTANCNRVNLVFVAVDECKIDRSDEDLPRLAGRTSYVALEYTINTGDFGQFVPRVEASFKYDIEYCFDRGSCESGEFSAGTQELYGFNMDWHAPDTELRISVFASNLKDADFMVGGVQLTDALGTGTVNAVAPRMWGGEAAYRW
jgi:iron complex outermembrane receptor protein